VNEESLSAVDEPADELEGDALLADRFRRHADSLARVGRSPLYVMLMRAAADDIAAGGRVAELFADTPVPPGSVPALRLLAALHHLVLSGRAPALAVFYPSAGGSQSPDRALGVALEVIGEHAGWIGDRLGRTVQTNEPGRAAVLFGALLWLVERYSLPVRLLEIGASAGVNLLADRFCYLVGDATLGCVSSPVRFAQPWATIPDIDLEGAARRLRIVSREGCDLSPLDPRDPEDRLTVLSYIWPDELDRLQRTRAALELAAENPPRVVAAPAEQWLSEALASCGNEQLTVVWQSVVRQYIEPASWRKIELVFDHAVASEHPIVWLRMEPTKLPADDFQLTIKDTHDQRLLARCGFHGPPVIWEAIAR
jgi:hypothetical protein